MSGPSLTGVVVQARATSTRLPAKVLRILGDRTVLAHVIGRCLAIDGVDLVCCAVPHGDLHDPVAEEAQAHGATVVRGSETDVLDRYQTAAATLGLKRIVRITSDCPLIDPAVCGMVLRSLIDADADYACNNMPPSFPHGLDCEAFTVTALARAAQSAVSAHDREHVTPWLRRTDDIKRVAVPGPGGSVAEQRWTLDYAEDYAFLSRLFAILPPPPARPSWREVEAVLARNPAIATLNAGRRDVTRLPTKEHRP